MLCLCLGGVLRMPDVIIERVTTMRTWPNFPSTSKVTTQSTQNISNIKPATPLRPGRTAGFEGNLLSSLRRMGLAWKTFLSYCGFESSSLRMHHLYKPFPAHVW